MLQLQYRCTYVRSFFLLIKYPSPFINGKRVSSRLKYEQYWWLLLSRILWENCSYILARLHVFNVHVNQFNSSGLRNVFIHNLDIPKLCSTHLPNIILKTTFTVNHFTMTMLVNDRHTLKRHLWDKMHS